MVSLAAAPEAAVRFLTFVNASPTAFHAVHNAALRLENAGFVKIKEKDDWEKDLEPGGKFYFTRNQSSLLAFTIPRKWTQGTGVSIIATHVDSPNLRVRPVSKRTKEGYLQLGVETYGAAIWHSWLDRDLSLAGRVVTSDANGAFTSKLVKIDRPILRIPTLAIHLDRDINKSFSINLETEMIPILGLVSSQLTDTPKDAKYKEHNDEKGSDNAAQPPHHPVLVSLLAEDLSTSPEEIYDFELALYDTQPSCLGGLNSEFIFSPRLDNLVSSFCALEAMCQSVSAQPFQMLEGNVNCIALFNHEEVGSSSTSGAASSLVPSFLERLSPNPAAYAQSIARSFLISSDVTHAIHPNYASKHEDNHKPRMNRGVVIKTNAGQKYTSDAIGSFIIKKLAEKHGIHVQEYEGRNDMVCGSTVGPILSKIGVRTVDVGNPILSMHSIRETAGSHDIQHAIDLFGTFFEGFAELDAKITVD